MPLILELKMIENQLWARIPSFKGDGAVSLWTAEEKEQLMNEVREQCADVILAARAVPQ